MASSPLPFAIMRGGPSDGVHTRSIEPNILTYIWLWLDISDKSMKLHCCGDYLREDGEWSLIDGVRHNNYRWAGWLWAPGYAREMFPPTTL